MSLRAESSQGPRLYLTHWLSRETQMHGQRQASWPERLSQLVHLLKEVRNENWVWAIHKPSGRVSVSYKLKLVLNKIT